MKHYEFHLLELFGELRRQNQPLTVRTYLQATSELRESSASSRGTRHTASATTPCRR
jgi:hypothetical protein